MSDLPNHRLSRQAATLTPLDPSRIRPCGWILRYMTEDLERGTTGRLDQIVPDIFQDELYGRDRRTLQKDTGSTGSELDWQKENPSGEVEMKWWNAETQGNWWDGYLRTVGLIGTEEDRARAKRIVEGLLATQDDDGYMGIYGADLRFQHSGENGELWAQAVIMRALLGWGEVAKDESAIRAVLRALDHTIDVLSSRDLNPFAVTEGWGGVSHGLMLTDVCEIAHRITGEERYLDFAARLYGQFSETPCYTDDLRQEILMQREVPFRGHGAHTYEHFRSLLLAAQVTGREDLQAAWEQALRKLQPCLLPGGAGIGFEFILGVSADTERTATEFCTMLELRNSFLSALQKLGDARFGDLAEELTYNSILGARAKDGRHLAYCITDSCYCLDSHEPRNGNVERRFKFSAAHQDIAICCAPNAARQFPTLLASMWAAQPSGFAAPLYGPCEMTGSFQGIDVRITEETDYPFSDEILFRIQCSSPVRFRLSLRIPSWKGGVVVEAGDAAFAQESGWTHLEKEWSSDTVRVTFNFSVEERVDNDGRRSVHRGPLLFVRPISSRIVETPRYPDGSNDLHFLAESSPVVPCVLAEENASWTLERPDAGQEAYWGVPAQSLRGTLRQNGGEQELPASLIPMAFTILRQASFDGISGPRTRAFWPERSQESPC